MRSGLSPHAPPTLLVGGVSQLYQGDLDLGRRVVESLDPAALGCHVAVEDFFYGAVAVAQRLEELAPESLVLVGAEPRGRAPGTVERRRVDPPSRSSAELQGAVGDAVTGYVGIDLIIDVAAALGVLPARSVVIEVEPAATAPDERLSPVGQVALDDVLTRIRLEVARAPLFSTAERVRGHLGEGRLEVSAAVSAMGRLLDELAAVDRSGHWGATFTCRDRLRAAIAASATGEGMSHLDWGLWWALIEELDRLQVEDASPT